MESEEAFARIIPGLKFRETVELIRHGLEDSGLKIFSMIDHSGAAKEVDLELFPAMVIIFGNPKGGTGLIQENPEIAIDLPAKILVYEKDGTHVLYRKLEAILKMHNMGNLAEKGKAFDMNVQKVLDRLK